MFILWLICCCSCVVSVWVSVLNVLFFVVGMIRCSGCEGYFCSNVCVGDVSIVGSMFSYVSVCCCCWFGICGIFGVWGIFVCILWV